MTALTRSTKIDLGRFVTVRPSLMPTNLDGLPIYPARSQVGLPSRSARTKFYREELVKHCECLEQQREYYSEKAITDVETALTRLIADVDELCARKNGDQLVSSLLRKIDGVTRLSAWSDPKKHH